VVPPTPSWGDMLAESIGYYQVAWWFIIFPGVFLLATTLAFNLLGDSLRDALDPRGERLISALRKGRRSRQRGRTAVGPAPGGSAGDVSLAGTEAGPR
jgi:hypothetical protein